MSKWQIPYPQEVKVAGYMDSEEPIYFQNMTMKQSEERLKKNDVLILPIVSTECHGYRGPGFTTAPDHPAGKPAPILEKALLPDYFEIDHVRVFDAVEA